MSISVEWDSDAHTIVHWRFQGRWGWKEYAVAQAQSDQLVDSVDHIVDLICDMRASPRLPENALSSYRAYLHRAPDNMDLIVLVGASRFVTAMVKVVMRVVPGQPPGTNFVFADTMAQGYALIADYQAQRAANNRH